MFANDHHSEEGGFFEAVDSPARTIQACTGILKGLAKDCGFFMRNRHFKGVFFLFPVGVWG